MLRIGIFLIVITILGSKAWANDSARNFNTGCNFNQNFFLINRIDNETKKTNFSININEKNYKKYQLSPFLKYENYYQIALIVEKSTKVNRAKAFTIYLFIPKHFLNAKEDFETELVALNIEDKKLRNGCLDEVKLEDNSKIYYFFADMDSKSDGSGGFNIAGFMQNSSDSTGNIKVTKIATKEDKVNGDQLSFRTLINLDLLAAQFKRRIEAQGATQDGICKRTSTKFKDQTANYLINVDMDIGGFVYLIQ
jgi:hypothetical protein